MFFQPSYPLSVEGEPYMFTPATGEGAGVKARDTEAHRNVFSGQGWGTNGFCSFTPLPLSPVISYPRASPHQARGSVNTLCLQDAPTPMLSPLDRSQWREHGVASSAEDSPTSRTPHPIETGWDLGPFAAVLVPGHTSP